MDQFRNILAILVQLLEAFLHRGVVTLYAGMGFVIVNYTGNGHNQCGHKQIAAITRIQISRYQK